MSDAPREPGFYWVKRNGGWRPAEWDAISLGGVFWIGEQDAYRESEFTEIGPKIEPPA